MSLPDLSTVLTSNLRSLHLAITDHLGQTFGMDHVKAHSAEVTPDTVRRFAQGKFAVWAVVAAGDGIGDSPESQLRMAVRWGIFIVAQALHEVPDELQPDRKQTTPAVQVAETIANIVLRLAHRTKWGLEIASQTASTSLSFRNLGAGNSAAQSMVEEEDIGLFVVWGTTELDMGTNMLPADLQLPPMEAWAGPIKDLCKPDEQPEVETQVTFTGLVRSALAAVSRWLFGPSWHEVAADSINRATRELVCTECS